MRSPMGPAVVLVGLMFTGVIANAADTASPGSLPGQESSDQWRSTKLTGVAIYGPDDKKVGNIVDMLVDHSGKLTHVIVGVGGFLGMGEKDVAIPFDQVKFTDKPVTPPKPAVAPQATAPAGGMAPNAMSDAGAAGGASGTPATAAPPPPTPSTAYPDHGTINMTADQLKSAPSFQFAK